MWNGSLKLAEGRVLPFLMNLDFSQTKPTGYFLVGDEKTPIPEISRDGDALILGFSEYGAEMRATWNGTQWDGEYLRHRATGTRSLPFVATPGNPVEASPAPAPAGNYQVYFQDEDRGASTTVARLWKNKNSLYGTFIAPDGDYGLLVGSQVGNRIQLNRFTGWQAMVIELEPSGETWSGRLYAASSDTPRAFTLEPREDLQIEPTPALLTRMKNPEAPFAFSGVSLEGETVRHTDERFKGKALIVDIMGTWCHNCLDEAPVLQQLKEEFGKDGLEIVGLSFEISDDPDLARKNLQLYKDRFGLTYTLLFCGILDETNVEKQLGSQLDNFFAYPTTLFIDPTGKVRSIHSGFRGPGTGDEFQRQIEEFRSLAADLTD